MIKNTEWEMDQKTTDLEYCLNQDNQEDRITGMLLIPYYPSISNETIMLCSFFLEIFQHVLK